MYILCFYYLHERFFKSKFLKILYICIFSFSWSAAYHNCGIYVRFTNFLPFLLLLCVFAIGLHRQLCSLSIFLQSKAMLSTYNTETWLFYFELLFISLENKTTVVLYTPPPSLVSKQHIREEWKKTLAKLENHVSPPKVLTSLQYKPSPLLVQTHLPID